MYVSYRITRVSYKTRNGDLGFRVYVFPWGELTT